LAKENVGGLGGVWYRIPADTRIPDHSIWQHCGLVSSLCSCFDLSKERRASLLVFSITPVQDFISRARKLRDFWISSLILSWLAFEGIREVIFRLGSDHVLYPSLVGQPLINWFLAKECGLKVLEIADANEVASFPNKFVCLVPAGQEGEFAGDIKQTILDAWIQLGTKTLELVEKKIGRKDKYLSDQFKRQLKAYWNFHWSACPLLDETCKEPVSQLLHRDVWERVLQFMEASKTLPHETKREGIFYGVTHALAQSFLAAGKTHRTDQRHEEPGIKCNLHGDFEALRLDWMDGDDPNPRPAKDPFWATLKSAWEPRSDFKPSERLSAISLVKRLAYRVCKDWSEHPLSIYFEEGERFPSTTEMALADWLDRVECKGFHREAGDHWRKLFAQVIHDKEKEESADGQGNEITEIDRENRAKCQKIIKRMEEEKDAV
jgi:CRISPR-associated protein Cmr2